MGYKALSLAISLMFASAALAETGNADLGPQVRGFADITAGIPAANGADKVLFFARDANGELLMTGIAMVPANGASPSAPADAEGVLRTRSSNAKRKKQPDAEDLRFASLFSVPVFVLGDWGAPATLWEMDVASAPRRFRTIAEDGSSGTWQVLAD